MVFPALPARRTTTWIAAAGLGLSGALMAGFRASKTSLVENWENRFAQDCSRGDSSACVRGSAFALLTKDDWSAAKSIHENCKSTALRMEETCHAWERLQTGMAAGPMSSPTLSLHRARALPFEWSMPETARSIGGLTAPVFREFSLALAGKAAATSGFSCGKVHDIPGVVACIFVSRETMSRFFLRSSQIIEGRRGKDETIVFESEYRGSPWWGFDLRANALAEALDVLAQHQPLLPEEKALRELLKRPHEGEAVIATSAAAVAQGTLCHELLHGLFFTNTPFRTAVLDEWKALPGTERQRFLSREGKAYAEGGEELLANEWMAYSLNAENKKLVPMGTQLESESVLEELRRRGADPFRVESIVEACSP